MNKYGKLAGLHHLSFCKAGSASLKQNEHTVDYSMYISTHIFSRFEIDDSITTLVHFQHTIHLLTVCIFEIIHAVKNSKIIFRRSFPILFYS